MSSPRKPFDRALFEKNDTLARSVITEHLAASGLVAVPHTKRYGIDLVVMDSVGKIVLGVECEIKRVWSGPVFPYETIQLPERKKKYLSDEYPIEYWLLNNEQTHAVVIPGTLVTAATPVEVRNKYVWRGEMFYQIPVAQCRLVEIHKTAMDTQRSSPSAEAGPLPEVGDSNE